MAWEAVEVLLVAGALLGFVLFALAYVTSLYGPTAYAPSHQPSLANLAQQTLDRIVFTSSQLFKRSGDRWRVVDLALSAPRPLYQPQLDETKLAILQVSAAGSLCSIEQKAFVDAAGVRDAFYVGFGVLSPAGVSTSLDYVRILRNFFGGEWDRFDFTLIIRPLVNLTICPNVRVGDTVIKREVPACSDVSPDTVVVRSTAGGRLVVTGIHCRIDVGCGVFSYDLSLAYVNGVWEARVPLPPSIYDGLGDTAGLALVAQKVDYPRAFDIFIFNTTSRSLVYGMYGPDGKLWLLHDHVVSCGSGNVAALGLRRLDVYTGGGFVTLVIDATLNPGVGAGSVKVDACQSCTETARCSACWVEPPANALFAVVWVERNSRGGSDPRSVMLLVPLVPTPPQSAIRIDTWLRWTPEEPKLQSAVATRIVDGQLATYQLQLILYGRP